MQTVFSHIPLTVAEFEEMKQQLKELRVEPVYAPSIVKSYFLSKPWVFLTADKISEATLLPVKQVRVICMRLVQDGWLKRTIPAWQSKTHYYWFNDFSKRKHHAPEQISVRSVAVKNKPRKSSF